MSVDSLNHYLGQCGAEVITEHGGEVSHHFEVLYRDEPASIEFALGLCVVHADCIERGVCYQGSPIAPQELRTELERLYESMNSEDC